MFNYGDEDDWETNSFEKEGFRPEKVYHHSEVKLVKRKLRKDLYTKAFKKRVKWLTQGDSSSEE